MDQQKGEKEEQQLSLFVNEEVKDRKLLIPIYRQAEQPLLDQGQWNKFEITVDELNLVKNFIHYMQDDKILLALYKTEPKKIRVLKNSLKDPGSFYKKMEGTSKISTFLFAGYSIISAYCLRNLKSSKNWKKR